MADAELAALVRYLNGARETFQGAGRTYHGGLEKFEPREMESLQVPSLHRLREMAKVAVVPTGRPDFSRRPVGEYGTGDEKGEECLHQWLRHEI